jgi:hypothetical protein
MFTAARPALLICSLPASTTLKAIGEHLSGTDGRDPTVGIHPCTTTHGALLNFPATDSISYNSHALLRNASSELASLLALIPDAFTSRQSWYEASERLLGSMRHIDGAARENIIRKLSAATRAPDPIASTRAGELLLAFACTIEAVDTAAIATTLLHRTWDTSHPFAARKFLKLLPQAAELLTDAGFLEIAKAHLGRPEFSPASEMLDRRLVSTALCKTHSGPLGKFLSFLQPFLQSAQKATRVKALEMFIVLLECSDMRESVRNLLLNRLLPEADNALLEEDERTRVSLLLKQLGADMLEHEETPLLLQSLLHHSTDGNPETRLLATELAAELLPSMPSGRRLDALMILSGRCLDEHRKIRFFANRVFKTLIDTLPARDRLALLLASGNRMRGNA